MENPPVLFYMHVLNVLKMYSAEKLRNTLGAGEAVDDLIFLL